MDTYTDVLVQPPTSPLLGIIYDTPLLGENYNVATSRKA